MAMGIKGLSKVLESLKRLFEKNVTKEDVESFRNTGESAAKSFESFAKVADQVSQTKIAENLDKLLLNINSFADLFHFGEEAQKYMTYSAYAAAAFAGIFPIISIAKEVYQAKNERRFRENLERKLDLLNAISIENMRLNAGLVLQNHHQLLHTQVNVGEDRPRFEALAVEARQILDHAPSIDMDILKPLAHELLLNLYASVDADPLDRVTSRIEDETLKAAIYSDIIPAHNASLLNVALVKKRYGVETVNALVEQICQSLFDNGGNSFYNLTVHLDGSRADCFYRLMNGILTAYQDGAKPENVSDNFIRFTAQLQHAKALITEKLRTDTNPVNDQVVTVVLNRAFLEYCKQTSAYFYFPWNLPAEVKSGLLSSVQTFTDPVQSLTTAFNLFTVAGSTRAFNNAYQRPVKTMISAGVVTTSIAYTALKVAARISSNAENSESESSSERPSPN